MNQLQIPGFERPHVDRCAVCGRKLTSTRSIKAGVGPGCRGSRGKRLLTGLRTPATSRTARELEKIMTEAAREIERLSKAIKKWAISNRPPIGGIKSPRGVNQATSKAQSA